MITKIDIDCEFDKAFIQAAQAYEEQFRSQYESIFLPSDQTIRASWGKMLERLSVAATSETMV